MFPRRRRQSTIKTKHKLYKPFCVDRQAGTSSAALHEAGEYPTGFALTCGTCSGKLASKFDHPVDLEEPRVERPDHRGPHPLEAFGKWQTTLRRGLEERATDAGCCGEES